MLLTRSQRASSLPCSIRSLEYMTRVSCGSNSKILPYLKQAVTTSPPESFFMSSSLNRWPSGTSLTTTSRTPIRSAISCGIFGLALMHERLGPEGLRVVGAEHLLEGLVNGRLPGVLRAVGVEELLLARVAGEGVPKDALEEGHHLLVVAHRESDGVLP